MEKGIEDRKDFKEGGGGVNEKRNELSEGMGSV